MKLRELRLKQGLSQAELARQAGVEQTRISALERERRTPHLATLERLAAALRCAPVDLLEDRYHRVPRRRAS